MQAKVARRIGDTVGADLALGLDVIYFPQLGKRPIYEPTSRH